MPARFRDLAHLGHVELFTPEFEKSVWFFNEILAMRIVAEEGDSVFLRTWDDYENYTLKLTARDRAGIGRLAYRASSPEALDDLVTSISESGLGEGWVDGEHGVGKSYAFADPDGHVMHVYWDSEWYQAPEDDRPALKNQAGKFPGRGINVRRLDHVNYLASDVEKNSEFVEHVLGMVPTEQVRLDSGRIAAKWFHLSDKSYDVVYSGDWTGSKGRLHHIAFATDTREDILRAADIALENGVHIETGPHKHAIQQSFFLYVWEPGGNRIEFMNQGARLVQAPDWKLIEWSETERKKGQAWGLKTIETFHTHGTPLV